MITHTWNDRLPLRTELRLRRALANAALDEEDRHLARRLRLIEAFERLNRRLAKLKAQRDLEFVSARITADQTGTTP